MSKHTEMLRGLQSNKKFKAKSYKLHGHWRTTRPQSRFHLHLRQAITSHPLQRCSIRQVSAPTSWPTQARGRYSRRGRTAGDHGRPHTSLHPCGMSTCRGCSRGRPGDAPPIAGRGPVCRVCSQPGVFVGPASQHGPEDVEVQPWSRTLEWLCGDDSAQRPVHCQERGVLRGPGGWCDCVRRYP